MGLINIRDTSLDVDIDIRYATSDNFTHNPVYRNDGCHLQEDAFEKLERSVAVARMHQKRIKIFDAYRPLEVQKRLWEHTPDPEFLSNPETGACPHCRGIAVDLTLVDSKGRELDMGTPFDAFTEASHHGSDEVSIVAQQNRMLLLGIMTLAGWDFYKNEWWHYQLYKPRDYPLLSDKKMLTGMA